MIIFDRAVQQQPHTHTPTQSKDWMMNRDKDTTVSPPSSSSSTIVRPTTTIASPYLVTQLQQVRLIHISTMNVACTLIHMISINVIVSSLFSSLSSIRWCDMVHVYSHSNVSTMMIRLYQRMNPFNIIMNCYHWYHGKHHPKSIDMYICVKITVMTMTIMMIVVIGHWHRRFFH